MDKKVILIVMGRYLPGYKDGGPVRSIQNLTDRLGEEYTFRILTTDRDHGDTKPYPGISYRDWNPLGKALVRYAKPGKISKRLILECADGADGIYVCGCLNDYARRIFKLKKAGKLTMPVTVAAMGLFAPGAFSIHHGRKQLYMNYLKKCKYLDQIAWSATNPLEEAQIRQIVSKEAVVFQAEDLPRKAVTQRKKRRKEAGECRIATLARISPEKNITYAIDVLAGLQGQVEFDIFGTTGNTRYTEECRKHMKNLPESVTCNLMGPLDSEKVIETLIDYDLFLLPTLGENYGHAIYEAMAAGCVPVISDRTRWTEGIRISGAGAAISLEDKEQFTRTIQKYVSMDLQRFALLSERAMHYAVTMPVDGAMEQYRKIFNQG